MMSSPELPKMGGGKKGRKAAGKKKGRKLKKGAKPKKVRKVRKVKGKKGKKPARRGRKSRYGEEEFEEEFEEEYEEEYEGEEYEGEEYEGEEYEYYYEEEYADEDYEEEYEDEGYTMVPGTYMTDKYMELHPGYFGSAQGQSASLTKTGKPTKPPTAGVSLFQNPFRNPFQGNADDAMMLSPMVEYEKSTGVPMNFAVVILAILFISFVMMRK